MPFEFRYSLAAAALRAGSGKRTRTKLPAEGKTSKPKPLMAWVRRGRQAWTRSREAFWCASSPRAATAASMPGTETLKGRRMRSTASQTFSGA